MRENKIPAVFKEDLEKLLISIKEYDHIKNSERHCIVCDRIVTVETIQFIIPRADNIFNYVCCLTSCVEDYTSKTK